jgi:ribosomal subunit interface protein
VSERTRAFAVERAEKLTRYHRRISRIQVILDEQHQEFSAEMIVHVDTGATLVCRESADGYRSALDFLMDKMERQLKRDKEKHLDHGRDSLRDMQLIEVAPTGDGAYDDDFGPESMHG